MKKLYLYGPSSTSNEHCTDEICVIKQISRRANIIKCIHPHQLRHSYATTLINNGAPLEVIQNLMGHEKSETTRIYAYLSGQLRRELYNKYF